MQHSTNCYSVAEMHDILETKMLWEKSMEKDAADRRLLDTFKDTDSKNAPELQPYWRVEILPWTA